MKNIIDFVKKELKNDNSGHGLQHALRVYSNAKKKLMLLKKETKKLFLLQH